jgi:hypothetical protein
MLMERTAKRDALFWDKVDKDPGEDTCWPWNGATHEAGYGIITETVEGVQRRHYAHKVSYEWAHGELPKGQIVRHRCDNPPCVRPSHLLSGTHQDNMDDMVERGRHVGNRIIDEAGVILIRERRAAGTASSVLAAEYGFSEQHVNAICRGRFWPEAGGPITARVTISDDLLRAVLSNKGSMTQKECAEIHGISKPAVQQIWSGFRRAKTEIERHAS